MTELPNLAGVATQSLVETLGGGSFKASYINWARTVQLLREHAPGWLPELVRTGDGGLLHRAPVGAYLLIRFKHADGTVTTEVPQAIMDTKNNSVPLDKITARDVTDTHRRGVCMAAAFTFGLAYELWAKMPLETGFAGEDKPPQEGAVQSSEVEPPAGYESWKANMTAVSQEGIMRLQDAWKESSNALRDHAVKHDLTWWNGCKEKANAK